MNGAALVTGASRGLGAHIEEYRREVPLGRMGTPAEIADVVAFLASDAARFITGERITVNGGHAMDSAGGRANARRR